jgi:hypothetical protein
MPDNVTRGSPFSSVTVRFSTSPEITGSSGGNPRLALNVITMFSGSNNSVIGSSWFLKANPAFDTDGQAGQLLERIPAAQRRPAQAEPRKCSPSKVNRAFCNANPGPSGISNPPLNVRING